MPKTRAHWTPGVTRTFLELYVREKNKLNWEYKQPTKLGWQNLYPDFYKATGLTDWEPKQLQNKFRDLRTHFIKWRNLNYRQSGLGRDKYTGDVTAPPDYWDDTNLQDSSQPATASQVPEDDIDPRRAPPCLDLLFDLFGHLPNDRGSLITSGGHTEASPPASDPATPPHAGIQGSGSQSQGPSSKRLREQEVTSPHKKVSAGSVGESLHTVAHSLKTIQQTYAPDASEMRRVHQLLHEDGLSEADDDYIHAVLLCTNPLDRMSFLTFSTTAGSCHDSSVLADCKAAANFPHPPQGRYYVVDSGYSQRQGFMGPYRGKYRKHIDQFQGVDRRKLSDKEQFNYAHSKIRNIVEKTFGLCKGRWQILKSVPFYEREKQVQIIVACFALNNWVWKCKYGSMPRRTYPLSDWVYINQYKDTDSLRDDITLGIKYDINAKFWPSAGLRGNADDGGYSSEGYDGHERGTAVDAEDGTGGVALQDGQQGASGDDAADCSYDPHASAAPHGYGGQQGWSWFEGWDGAGCSHGQMSRRWFHDWDA